MIYFMKQEFVIMYISIYKHFKMTENGFVGIARYELRLDGERIKQSFLQLLRNSKYSQG